MEKKSSGIPARLILTFLAIICVVLLFIDYATDFSAGPVNVVADYFFVPMQKGINFVGTTISVNSDEAKAKKELVEENKALKAQVNELTTQLTNMRLQQTELSMLRELYQLDEQYTDYEKIGAHVIAKGESNWFSTFTIDKGSKDGIELDMNVIAGSGLVGIVTEVGKNYSVCRAVIDDTSSVSATVLDTSDLCIVSGDLTLMTEDGRIRFSGLSDTEDNVAVGGAVVTSNISDKYLSGILIGYIDSIENDENHLTKSGTITPVVDFKKLQEVLVITTVKKTKD